jgi:hypothetical protein
LPKSAANLPQKEEEEDREELVELRDRSHSKRERIESAPIYETRHSFEIPVPKSKTFTKKTKKESLIDSILKT